MTLHLPKSHLTAVAPQLPEKTVGHAMEKPAIAKNQNTASTPTLEQRLTANATEWERLQRVEAELKLRKRDLLHSDTEGNRVYAIDLASYNEALAKATAEKNALAAAR